MCALCAVIETLTYRAHWLRRLVADQIPGAREGVEPWRECFSVDPVRPSLAPAENSFPAKRSRFRPKTWEPKTL